VVHKDALQRIASDEDDPDEERLFRDLWDDETQREVVIDCLKADCEVRTGRACLRSAGADLDSVSVIRWARESGRQFREQLGDRK
jgi:hypothetical protein